MSDRVAGRVVGRVDGVPRLYLREFVDGLDKSALYDSYNPMEKYAFVAKENDTSLKEVENAVMEVSWREIPTILYFFTAYKYPRKYPWIKISM